MSLTKFLSNTADCLQPRRARRKEARPGELLDAALSLFVEKGFAATRAEDVARRAGVSKGTLFLYFATKEDLFKAVVRESISGYYPVWVAELESFSGSTADLLRKCLGTWWERVGASRASGISKLMLSEARNFPDLALFYQREVIDPGKNLIHRILQRGIDSGEFRPVPLTYGVYAVLSHMIFLGIWKHSLDFDAQDAGRLDPQQYLDAQVDILLNGLLVSGQAADTSGEQQKLVRT